jgi:hypothetical protein
MIIKEEHEAKIKSIMESGESDDRKMIAYQRVVIEELMALNRESTELLLRACNSPLEKAKGAV